MELHGIFGAGGFGRMVMTVANTMLNSAKGTRNYELVFVVENLKHETVINGYRTLDKEDFLSCEADRKYFNVSIADYKARERIALQMIDAGISPFSIAASNSIYSFAIFGKPVSLV